MDNYVLIQENDFQKARRKINEARKNGKAVIFSSNDDELNRKILEKENVDCLLINLAGRKDSRVRQNIKLCNKNKLKMTFISKEKQDTYNLKSLGLVLGMPTWMTKEI
ncbi:hypothetical protein J4422_03775 [Candidatus Pacearchaeota archaeon]|nr:hypothetical protein [Candidatus Pacearchaeota archaeon]